MIQQPNLEEIVKLFLNLDKGEVRASFIKKGDCWNVLKQFFEISDGFYSVNFYCDQQRFNELIRHYHGDCFDDRIIYYQLTISRNEEKILIENTDDISPEIKINYVNDNKKEETSIILDTFFSDKTRLELFQDHIMGSTDLAMQNRERQYNFFLQLPKLISRGVILQTPFKITPECLLKYQFMRSAYESSEELTLDSKVDLQKDTILLTKDKTEQDIGFDIEYNQQETNFIIYFPTNHIGTGIIEKTIHQIQTKTS